MGTAKITTVAIDGAKLKDAIEKDGRFSFATLSQISGQGKSYLSNAFARNACMNNVLHTVCLALERKESDFYMKEKKADPKPKESTSNSSEDIGKAFLLLAEQLKVMNEKQDMIYEKEQDRDAAMVSMLKIIQRIQKQQEVFAEENIKRHYTSENAMLNKIYNHLKYSGKISDNLKSAG